MTTRREPMGKAPLARDGHREPGWPRPYRRACRLAERGRFDQARRIYATLEATAAEPRLRALVANDLAVFAILDGELDAASFGLRSALALDGGCEPARLNAVLLLAETGRSTVLRAIAGSEPGSVPTNLAGPCRVAILSALFNWPSTGGGTVHTAELARSLADAGYEVRHLYSRHPGWGLGSVQDPTPHPCQAVEFDDASWNAAEIRARFRRAVDDFGPDYVLITDSWNTKPILAEAVRGYPYLLRFQAMECLCPLNNLRLLARGQDGVEQCPRHQLATPEVCHRCLDDHGRESGQLHQLERTLAGVGTSEYDRALRQALSEAEAVLVLNPLTEAILSPYARRVCVVPWGMAPARFPWPPPDVSPESSRDGVVRLFMAAVAGEFIKGFHVLHEACRRLRRTRADFELVVTFDPPGRIDEFTRSVGWLSQEELPRHYRASDLCIVPTIAQEGLSRTSVEAMASGIPVIASRIGGLPYTVSDGATGLLFEPGDSDDLARKIATLLDDPPLRKRMGLAGRKRFEDDFTWDVVIERYYRPLLTKRRAIHG